MHEDKERDVSAASFQPGQQSRWEAVLDLGVLVAWHKSDLDKECFERDSNFISMP
jgi:hypothetical protein